MKSKFCLFITLILICLVSLAGCKDTENMPNSVATDSDWGTILEDMEASDLDDLTDEEMLDVQEYMMGGYSEIPEGEHGGVVIEFEYTPEE